MATKDKVASISITKELSEGLVLHKDLKQEIIITEENRFRLYLIEYANTLKGKNQWIPAFGIFLTFIITISTVKFQTIYSIDEKVWQAMFIICTISSSLWLLVSIYKSIKAHNKGGIDSLIEKLKNRQDNESS